MPFCTFKNIVDPVCRTATYNADVMVGEFIIIHGQAHGKEFSRRFDVGDAAQHGSYNFRYVGPIVSIGEKTITIDVQGEGKRRLKLWEFIRMNHDFNQAAIDQHNARTSESV